MRTIAILPMKSFDAAKQRLKVIYETTDGFEIARQDLLIRGPGEFLGARQSGVPLLRFADIERDMAKQRAAYRTLVETVMRTAGNADPDPVLEPGIGTEHETAGLARETGGIAVRAGLTEAAEALAPDTEHTGVNDPHRHRSGPAGQVRGVGRRQEAVIGHLGRARRRPPAQAVEDRLGVGRGVEGIGRDAEEPLGLVEEIVEFGEEVDALGALGARAGARPVC